jgi:GTP pyrophosphokinase
LIGIFSKQQKGEDMLTDFFHQENLPSNDENIKKLCNLHHVKNYDELTLNIGQGIFGERRHD